MQETSERGFTLVELLAVMAIGAMLLGLGAGALRNYTRGKALQGARDMTVTSLRNAQQRTFSEGYPRAYGIRFLKGGTRWDVVRYDASAGTCTVVESNVLADGVSVATGTDFPEGAAATACRNAAPNGSADYEVALFYARGSATAGTIEFALAGSSSTRTVRVNATTGSVS